MWRGNEEAIDSSPTWGARMQTVLRRVGWCAIGAFFGTLPHAILYHRMDAWTAIGMGIASMLFVAFFMWIAQVLIAAWAEHRQSRRFREIDELAAHSRAPRDSHRQRHRQHLEIL